jgi:hypothetical protein
MSIKASKHDLAMTVFAERDENDRLRQQRDRLLAALEDVWAWAHSDRDWTLDAAVWRQVEAAIAQAKEEMGT